MRSFFQLSVVAAILALSVLPSSAQQVRRVEVGSLNCNVGPSLGLIIGSQQQLACLFRSRNTGRREFLRGRYQPPRLGCRL